MEYLKELFGDRALTFAEFAEAVGGAQDVKLANLAAGEYVGREKFEAEEGRRKTVERKIEEERERQNGEERRWSKLLDQTRIDAQLCIDKERMERQIERALLKAGALDTVAARALIDMPQLYESPPGQMDNELGQQVEKLKTEKGFLFGQAQQGAYRYEPTGGQGQQGGTSSFIDIIEQNQVRRD